tara:strand:+ start:21 stop:560 length:540 start_codon:yes stop_codon:yes gene_type:complete
MALWGVSDSDESKPKYLKQEDKNNCVAKEEGWVLKKSVGSRELEEVLVAVSGATNLATALGNADITGVYFEAASYDQGDSANVIVVYNENVDVTNGATLTVGATGGSDVTATAAAHDGKNKVSFAFTVPSRTCDLSIAAQTISGTIVDDGTSTASDKAFVAGDLLGATGTGTYAVISVA